MQMLEWRAMWTIYGAVSLSARIHWLSIHLSFYPSKYPSLQASTASERAAIIHMVPPVCTNATVAILDVIRFPENAVARRELMAISACIVGFWADQSDQINQNIRSIRSDLVTQILSIRSSDQSEQINYIRSDQVNPIHDQLDKINQNIISIRSGQSEESKRSHRSNQINQITYLITVCRPGRYGIDCASKCECYNGAMCDPIGGQCTCSSGWLGATCQTEHMR